MYTQEQLSRIWLQSTDALSWNGIDRLLIAHGSALALWEGFSPAMEEALGAKAYHDLAERRKKGHDALLSALDKAGAFVVFDEDAEYPPLLRSIAQPPRMLFVRGKLPKGHTVSIVGSRADTRYGRSQAHAIAKGLAREGVAVISGLARGIDTAAHEGALEGGGATIGVLGCGIDRMYPAENEVLAAKMLEKGGAVITEFAPGAQPLRFHFPLRNRIISGLCEALLLIEAKLLSGTNSTINYALAQGRDIFALPGNVDAPGSELPLRLLRDGAYMATCAEDILSIMGWKAKARQITFMDVPMEDSPILRALALEEKTFEELLQETALDSGQLGAELTLLEIDGRIEKRAGRAYGLIRN